MITSVEWSRWSRSTKGDIGLAPLSSALVAALHEVDLRAAQSVVGGVVGPGGAVHCVAQYVTAHAVAFHATVIAQGRLLLIRQLFQSSGSSNDESRLNALGLSSELLHTALRPGLSRASNRTALALPSTPGTDIYHDTMEQLPLCLMDKGWSPVLVDRQPRFLHPEGLLSFTVASADNVANPDRRKKPRAYKGPSTRGALAVPPVDTLALFAVPEAEHAAERAQVAKRVPLWFLLHERTDRGLKLEFSCPAGMTGTTGGGVVYDWDDRIFIPFMDLDGDLAVFDDPNDGEGGIDVQVEPLT